MSKHRKSSNHSHQRRDQFVHPVPRRRSLSPTGAVLGVAAVLAVVLVYLIATSGQVKGQAAVTDIGAPGSDVTLPVATFSDGQARFYRYTTAGGREVRFFVMRSSDGQVRAAFDACDTCYRERKGYHQQGDVMVCNNCSRAFRSVDINVLQGGCNPAPLNRTVVGDQVVLTAASLESGTLYF